MPLPGVAPFEALSLTAAALLLLAVTLLASLLPARRAMTVNPAEGLRQT